MGNGARLIDLLFPSNVVCKLCGEEAILDADGLCASCRAELVRFTSPIVCPPGLDVLTAALLYDGPVASAIQRFKYGRQVWLAPYLASFLSLPTEWRIDCLVPVPLHPLREWMRSFNQSALLAEQLQRRYPYPVSKHLLNRTRYTQPQAKLDAAGRATNLNNAFIASPSAKGLSLVLIDDVTTTHSTLLACADALRRQGAARVYGACVAATDRIAAQGSVPAESDAEAPHASVDCM